MSGPPDRTTTDEFSIGGASARDAPQLSWTDQRGRHTAPLEDRASVGSAPEAGIVVVDPTVSRLHAELELRDDGLWIKDLGSKNGTFVEGVRVASARIPPKGRIRLGSATVGVAYATPGEPQDLWPEDHYRGLVGESRVMRALFSKLHRVARSQASVLIQGETGTGKELVARAIHEGSARAPGPFVVVDCAAIPETLFESQLFGHAKGAFTGASSPRAGDIEAADGGTVFLDEIGELPLAMQPKLLRVIESRTVRRLGETAVRPVDVRFLAATHRDLASMVNGGGFREDLYFRLAVVPIRIPPLRKRLEDIPRIVEHLLPKGSGSVTPELFAELSQRPWLGNVRELRNFVERALALGTDAALDPSVDEPESTHPRPARGASSPNAPVAGVSRDQPLRTFREQWSDVGEREYLRHLLAAHPGNVSAAARAAGVDRTYLHRLIKRHGL